MKKEGIVNYSHIFSWNFGQISTEKVPCFSSEAYLHSRNSGLLCILFTCIIIMQSWKYSPTAVVVKTRDEAVLNTGSYSRRNFYLTAVKLDG